MKRELLKTADGSMTIYLPDLEEHYHSKHGALQEAVHVFLKMGLRHIASNFKDKPLKILEIGFGTGLNCILTYYEAQKLNLNIAYTGIEAFPVTSEELKALDYGKLLVAEDSEQTYKQIHEVAWEESVPLTPQFSLHKQQKKFEEITAKLNYDLIYFDAFGARVQPELWTESIFETMYNALKKNGVLVTYAAKGSVRRAMQSVGFTVERLEGPPGKREMLRATKLS